MAQHAPRETPIAAATETVSKTYFLGKPVHALEDVSVSLPEGSFTAVMGPSGSGKSTLMNLLGCLETPDEGVVTVGGELTGELSDAERARLRGTQIGFVFQTFNLMPRLTAAENVTLPMLFHDVIEVERRERARQLLERVGLHDRLDHEPSELSGGQRQRVAIARALANEPTIILADEPTGNLDTETGERIMKLFCELNAAGTTILMVTHERRIAEYADRIIHLLDGQVEAIEDVSNAPQSPRSESPESERSRARERKRDGVDEDDSGSEAITQNELENEAISRDELENEANGENELRDEKGDE